MIATVPVLVGDIMNRLMVYRPQSSNSSSTIMRLKVSDNIVMDEGEARYAAYLSQD